MALLHLFQGFVDIDVLRVMGYPESGWCLPEVKALTREVGIVLLDRAADVGLLIAHGGGGYSIHPALPWFFRRLFEQHYSETCVAAHWVFLEEPIGELENHYAGQYERGDRDAIGVLKAEEANFLHARSLARSNEWWRCVIFAMQGLRALHQHSGRLAEWSCLVEEIVPDFVDPANEGPLPGKEEEWNFVAHYRVRLASEARRWEEAERLQGMHVAWNRRRVAATLTKPPQVWDAAEKASVLRLAASLEEQADTQRQRGRGGLRRRLRGGAVPCGNKPLTPKLLQTVHLIWGKPTSSWLKFEISPLRSNGIVVA